jgi:uncharacterized protein (UPF0332 family)
MAKKIKRIPLHEQLLQQAAHLATKDKRGNPPQASLRRAISTAYYAVFHLLIHAAATGFARGPERIKLRNLLSRTFDHGEMKSACDWFCAISFPQCVTGIWPVLVPRSTSGSTPRRPIPSDLHQVADAFRQLQAKRHKADYAVNKRFTRTEAIEEVNRATDAFAAWARIRRDPMARLFLTCLLVGKKLQGR